MINSILILSAIMTVVIMSILNNSFKNGTFTCDKYILNTYLYLILAIVFVALFVQTLTLNNVDIFVKMIQTHKYLFLFGILIGLIGSIIGMAFTDPTNVIIKHLWWTMFITFSAILFQPIHMMYIKSGQQQVIINALIITFILVATLTGIAFYKPDFIKLSWGPVLFFALLGAIIVEVISILTNSHSRIMHYIVIAIFIGYLLYDTKFMRERAKKCLVKCDYYNFNRLDPINKCVKPDYIKESVNLFLDIYNLFLRILGLGSN